jgi:hypothetical protein
VENGRTGRRFDTPAAVGCECCEEPIGVYEPIVELTGDVARRTSLAAEPRFAAAYGSTLFHAACYDERISQPKP